MKVNISNEYLTGKKINNGKTFNFFDQINKSRIEVLSEIVSSNKDINVVHLGACDHESLIDEKIKNNNWLHKIISDNCEEVVGFDINSTAVKYCNEIGWTNIFFADMTKDIEFVLEKLSKKKWDYMIAGEVVEHLNNPVEFLSAINKNYAKVIDRVIITVPNALSFTNIKMSLKGRECINTDHRYWFTPYTICKIAYESGLIPETILYADQCLGRLEKFFMELFFKRRITCETLILIAKLTEQNDYYK